MTSSQTMYWMTNGIVTEVPFNENSVYFRELHRQRLHQALLKAFEEARCQDGLNQAELARRIGRSPAYVSRMFSEPGNLTLGTISDFLLGMGAQLKFDVVFFQNAPTPNCIRPLAESSTGLIKDMNLFAPIEIHVESSSNNILYRPTTKSRGAMTIFESVQSDPKMSDASETCGLN
jgi:AraC-like DNA-binding protein